MPTRLIEKNINTAEEYDRIYNIRKVKGLDEFDFRRWKELLSYYKGGRLIDLGCLDSLVPALAKRDHPKDEIWGIDQASEAIDEMQARFPKILYHVGDVYDTKFRDSYFDYAVAGELIEHLEDPKKFIRETMRIVKSRGVVAISTPLDEATEPGAVDKDRHLWSYTEEDIRKLLEPFGEVKIKILRSIRKPVYRYCWPQMIAWVTKK